MISSLTIQNFLSHKYTELNFSPGVNVVVGPTDSGKSALVKALKWVIFNRPMGDGMISTWAGDRSTAVEIIVDKVSVIRERGKGINSYFLDDLQFNAVKGDVPAEVTKSLNFSDVNLQTQFDSHFLLSNSSGEVAQYFNKIAHLDRIDIALQNIRRWHRDVQKKLEYDEQALETSRERLLEFDFLNDVEKELIDLETKENARNLKGKERSGLVSILASLEEVEEDLSQVSFLADLDRMVHEALETIGNQKHLKNQMASLTMLLSSINEMASEEQELKKELAKMEKQFHQALGKGSICPLCEQVIK